MKKILVMSDSHGRKLNMQSIMEAHEDAYAMVFLGDGENDMEECELYYPHMFNRTVSWVKGNCDWFSVRPIDETMNIAEFRILCTHGHYYDVKNGLTGLKAEGAKGRYDLVLFGHTHIPYCSGKMDKTGLKSQTFCSDFHCNEKTVKEPVLFNPGSVADGKYGLIYIDDLIPEKRAIFELLSL